MTNALSNSHAQQGYPPQQSSNSGGVLDSILGALGGSSGNNIAPPPTNQPSDPLTGALGSIIGGVFGNDGNQKSNYQPSGGYGNYQPSGGYSSQQSNSGSDLLSGIGSAIGSSLFNSALGGLKKHGKDKSLEDNHSTPPSTYTSNSMRPSDSSANNSSSGHNLTAEEISKGLGLDD